MADWTPAEDEDLFRMWNGEGLSAGMCAQRLPGRSRNACIGRVNRMGWCRPHAAAPGTALRYPKRISAPKIERKRGSGNAMGSAESLFIGHRKAPLPAQRRDELRADPVESLNARPWTERAIGQCAYPMSGTGADTVSCCNATTATYCSGHEALMYSGSPAVNPMDRGDKKTQRGLSRADRFFMGYAA